MPLSTLCDWRSRNSIQLTKMTNKLKRKPAQLFIYIKLNGMATINGHDFGLAHRARLSFFRPALSQEVFALPLPQSIFFNSLVETGF